MDKYPFIHKETHPHLEALFHEFLQEHQHELSNRVIESFLSSSEYYRLFVDAVCFPTPGHRERLDEAFHRFFSEIRLIHYISKLISRVSRDCYQREKKRLHHVSTSTLFYVLQSEGIAQEPQFSEKGEEVIDIVVRNAKRLLEHVSHPSLYQALTHLTKRQLDILELYFLYHLTHEEIGQVLGISQQSVSKSYNKALAALRVFYREGEGVGPERMD